VLSGIRPFLNARCRQRFSAPLTIVVLLSKRLCRKGFLFILNISAMGKKSPFRRIMEAIVDFFKYLLSRKKKKKEPKE
jgi:hypothetical protein